MSIVIDADAEDWDRVVLGSDVLVVVDFWHERCPWCLMLNPILEEVAREYGDKITFVKFNVLKSWRNREIAMSYGVMGTPTIAFFCKGEYVGSIIGFIPKEHLKHLIEDMMNKYRECVKQRTKLENLEA